VFIGQGLIIGGVPYTWNELINGIVLGAAVAFATLLRGRDAAS
jgi:ribose/xylose/arabinose/galactoside ABC-type transport system permease subunit